MRRCHNIIRCNAYLHQSWRKKGVSSPPSLPLTPPPPISTHTHIYPFNTRNHAGTHTIIAHAHTHHRTPAVNDLSSNSQGIVCGLLLSVQGVAMEEGSQVLAPPAAAGRVCWSVLAVRSVCVWVGGCQDFALEESLASMWLSSITHCNYIIQSGELSSACQCSSVIIGKDDLRMKPKRLFYCSGCCTFPHLRSVSTNKSNRETCYTVGYSSEHDRPLLLSKND